jgi:hypothetical protein
MMPSSIVAGESGLPSYSVQTMHENPWFITVALASTAGWIVGTVKGFKTSAEWWTRYLKSPHVLLVFLTDFFVFVVVGAYLGTGIYDPHNFVSAVAAGLSWPIGFGALAATGKNGPDASDPKPQG